MNRDDMMSAYFPPEIRVARPIPIRLLPCDLALADSWQRAILDTGLEQRPNYIGQTNPERYRVGFLGELALRRWFEFCDTAYVHHVSVLGRSAGPDFTVAYGGTLVPLEVKTAGKPTYRELRVAVEQGVRIGALYVGARLLFPEPDCWIELWGWDHGAAVAQLPTLDHDGHPLHYKPLADMTDMLELMVMLSKRQQVAM